MWIFGQNMDFCSQCALEYLLGYLEIYPIQLTVLVLNLGSHIRSHIAQISNHGRHLLHIFFHLFFTIVICNPWKIEWNKNLYWKQNKVFRSWIVTFEWQNIWASNVTSMMLERTNTLVNVERLSKNVKDWKNENTFWMFFFLSWQTHTFVWRWLNCTCRFGSHSHALMRWW